MNLQEHLVLSIIGTAGTGKAVLAVQLQQSDLHLELEDWIARLFQCYFTASNMTL